MTLWPGERYFPLSSRTDLLQAEPGELAFHILQYLNDVTDGTVGQGLHDLKQHAFLTGLHANWSPEAKETERHHTDQAVVAAWKWLEAHELLAVNERGEAIVTPRGRAVRARSDLTDLIRRPALPRIWLHAALRDEVGPLYDQGNYEAAVLRARESIEAAMRQVTGLSPAAGGPGLARQAFAPGQGNLADPQTPKGQQETIADLFAGAVGYLRQRFAPGATPLTDPVEAAELLLLAGHLLRLVEARTVTSAP